MLFSDFRCKSVINLRDCKCLGRVSDLEFDERTGCICSIIVPKGGKFCDLLKTKSEIVIPFKEIKKIGPDIILVDICEC